MIIVLKMQAKRQSLQTQLPGRCSNVVFTVYSTLKANKLYTNVIALNLYSMLLPAQNSHGTRPADFAANKRKLISLTFHKLGPYAHPSIALLCCCVRHSCSLLRRTGALFSNTRRLNNYNVPIIHNGILDFHSHFPPAHVLFVVNNRVAKLTRNRKSERRPPVWFTLKGMLRTWHEQWHQQKANERWNYCVQVAVAGFIREKKNQKCRTSITSLICRILAYVESEVVRKLN